MGLEDDKIISKVENLLQGGVVILPSNVTSSG